MQNDTPLRSSLTKKRKQSENSMSSEHPSTGSSSNDINDTNILQRVPTAITDDKDRFLSEGVSSNSWCTIENMLAVPIEYIFRDVPIMISTGSTDASVGWSPATPRSNTMMTNVTTSSNHTTKNHRQKPLLSRIEAQLFLQVNTLTYEIDTLTSVAVTALQHRIQYREFSTSLQRVDHPYLRPLISMLHMYHETVPNSTIHQVSNVMESKIIPEFQRLLQQLRQCSEQNWTLADTLDDGMNGGGYHNMLADEKRKLSDVQEEVCQRIEMILHNASSSTTATTCNNSEETIETQPSMKEYCDRLFRQQDELLEHDESNTMELVVHHTAHEKVVIPNSSVNSLQNDLDENVDDDELLEEAPDLSPTTTPMSSPEESPTLIQATSATRASILRNSRMTATTTTSPLASFPTTNTKTTPTPQRSDVAAQHTTPIPTNTSCAGVLYPPKQRQLQKPFESTNAIESPTENEKENEPSQASSQRSSQSVKRQRLESSVSETPPPPTTAISMERKSSTQKLIHATTQPQPFLKESYDEEKVDDDDIDEFVGNDCFRTQCAAEVLSSLARPSTNSEDNR